MAPCGLAPPRGGSCLYVCRRPPPPALASPGPRRPNPGRRRRGGRSWPRRRRRGFTKTRCVPWVVDTQIQSSPCEIYISGPPCKPTPPSLHPLMSPCTPGGRGRGAHCPCSRALQRHTRTHNRNNRAEDPSLAAEPHQGFKLWIFMSWPERGRWGRWATTQRINPTSSPPTAINKQIYTQ